MGRVFDLGVASCGIIANDGTTVTVGALAVLIVIGGRATTVQAAVGALGTASGTIGRRCVGGPAADVGAVVGGRGTHGAKNLALLRRVAVMAVVGSTSRGGIGKGTGVGERRRGLAADGASSSGRAPAAIAVGGILAHLIAIVAATAAADEADGGNSWVGVGVVRVVLNLLAALFFGFETGLALPPPKEANDGKNSNGGNGDDDADGNLARGAEAAAAAAARNGSGALRGGARGRGRN